MIQGLSVSDDALFLREEKEMCVCCIDVCVYTFVSAIIHILCLSSYALSTCVYIYACIQMYGCVMIHGLCMSILVSAMIPGERWGAGVETHFQEIS